jgi:hypothetical protein
MMMVPWLSNEMDHVTAMGGAFTTQSSDLGDISVSVLVPFARWESSAWQLGLSLPTGNLDRRDTTPMGRTLLPYPMQIGTGTYDLLLGYNFNRSLGKSSIGGQVKGRFPLGENDEHYAVGNRFEFSVWYAKRLGDFSLSLRTQYQYLDNYRGADPRYQLPLANNLIPTVDPDLRGGERLDVGLGVNWAHSSGLRLAFEYSLPAYQDLDGPQLEVDSAFTFGVQFSPTRRH